MINKQYIFDNLRIMFDNIFENILVERYNGSTDKWEKIEDTPDYDKAVKLAMEKRLTELDNEMLLIEELHTELLSKEIQPLMNNNLIDVGKAYSILNNTYQTAGIASLKAKLRRLKETLTS